MQAAKRLARPVLNRWESEFAQIRQRRSLTEDDLQEAVWERYVELIEADERFRLSLPTNEDLDEIWKALEREFDAFDLEAFRIFEFIRNRFESEREERTKRLASLRAQAARGETELVTETTRRAIDKRRLDVPRDSATYRRLAQGLQRAELEALARANERDQGDWGGEPRDKLIKPPAPKKSSKAAPGELITELFEIYARENPNSVKVDTLNQSRMAVGLFSEMIGARFPVASIDKKAVRQWKALLTQYPVKAAEIAAFRGMSMSEIVAANASSARPTISPRTVNRYLSSLGAFCDWLVAHDYLGRNPVGDMHISVRRQSFWDSERRHLREALARLVDDAMRLADDAASVGLRWSVV